MLFGKKKDSNSLSVIHYEGLPNFAQDFPCKMTLEDEMVIFSGNDGSVAKLACSQIQGIDAMPEANFQAKYHNFNGTTKKAPVWFRVIRYTSSSGEEKYIALWTAGIKDLSLFDKIVACKTPTETIL